MKLEDLAPANGIEHLNAHDALGDTLATRDLAQQLAQKHPICGRNAYRWPANKP